MGVLVKSASSLSGTVDVTGTLSDSTGNVTVGDNLDVDGTIADPNSTLTLKGGDANGGSAVGIVLDNANALTTSGARHVSIKTGGTEVWKFDTDGTYQFFRNKDEKATLQATSTNGYLTLAGTSAELTMVNTGSKITARGYIQNDSGSVTLRAGNETGNVTALKLWPYAGTTTASTKLIQVYKDQGTTEVMNLDGVGALTLGSTLTVGGALVQNNTDAPLELKGWSTDSATASGVRFYTGNALSTAGATVAQFWNYTARKISFSHNGSIEFYDRVINTTPGDSATINAPSGRFRKDNSGATFTLTNNCITANSQVICQICSTTPGVSITAVVPASGSASIEFSAAPAGDVDVNFVVFN